MAAKEIGIDKEIQPKENRQQVDLKPVDDSFGVVEELTAKQRASLEIARYVLLIFAGVYSACFLIVLGMFYVIEDMTSDQATEIIKYMLGSVLPLVTLAVGYYLGDKGNG